MNSALGDGVSESLNTMEMSNITFLGNQSRHLSGNATDGLKRNVITAILFSALLHVWGGLVFLQVTKEVPNHRPVRPIEISIVTPAPKKTIIPLPSPIVPRPVHQVEPPPRSKPAPAPVAPQRPAPIAEHATPPQEIKKTAEKVVQASQPSPEATSRGKATANSQTPGMPFVPAAQAPAATDKAKNSEAPLIGPDYGAAYLNNPVPHYPAAARRLKLQGTATVRVLVTPDGRPKSVKLEKSSGARILDEAALEAVQHWSFVPARHGDKLISAEVDVPVRFRLN